VFRKTPLGQFQRKAPPTLSGRYGAQELCIVGSEGVGTPNKTSQTDCLVGRPSTVS